MDWSTLFKTAVTTLISTGGGVLVSKGFVTASTEQEVAGFIVIGVAWIAAHLFHSNPVSK